MSWWVAALWAWSVAAGFAAGWLLSLGARRAMLRRIVLLRRDAKALRARAAIWRRSFEATVTSAEGRPAQFQIVARDIDRRIRQALARHGPEAN